jgi:Anti-sigma factor NepR
VKSNRNGNASRGGSLKISISSQSDAVGQRLRDFFSAIEDEGIPERFLDLLDKLDAAENAATKQSGASDSNGAKDGR